MEIIKRAILKDLELANNGYSGTFCLIPNVTRATGLPAKAVLECLGIMLREHTICRLGVFDRQTYYCAAVNYDRVRACLIEWQAEAA